MHDNILSDNQKNLLPFIGSFHKEFYLAGGTAVALQIGHRASIDFDMFKLSNIQKTKISLKLKNFDINYQLLFTDSESFHILANGVKMTFFQYPFNIPTKVYFENIKMPDLIHLAAMKAYALGRRAKWKDYVDLYFILKDFYSLNEISSLTQKLFGELFSPKLFKQQLCYFNDIDYSEEVNYCIEPVNENTIKSFLTELATSKIQD